MTETPWISRLADATSARCQVSEVLHRLQEVWPEDTRALEEVIHDFPSGPESVARLLAASKIAGERMIKRPNLLIWLAEPQNCLAKSRKSRLAADLRQALNGGPSDSKFTELRLLKAREMARIALRDVAGLADLEETTADLSDLAAICLDEVTRHWMESLTRQWGDPGTPFTILGMGKFGGHELNYSSDIDLIFLYGEEGEVRPSLSRHQFFTRLAEKVLASFGETRSEGPLFRVDMRLRPEGDSGPLVRSLDSMENYYAAFGETWERMVLIKARGVAGDEELAYEFCQFLQPFIYPKIISPDILDEVADVKRRIEKAIGGGDHMHRHVKLGQGGIREIEFVTQSLQLLHGARNAFLQEPNTLKALQALVQAGLMRQERCEALSSAYRFLRQVEHRLQMDEEKQTHTLPDDCASLADGLGFESETAFSERLQSHQRAVREAFDDTITKDRDEAEKTPAVALDGFRDPGRAQRDLDAMGVGSRSMHVSSRTRRLFDKLRPVLADQLSQGADPDGALTRLTRFVESYGIRGMLFETLLANPRLLELLCKLFDASPFASEMVFRHPQLIEEIARAGTLDHSMDVAAHLEKIKDSGVKLHEYDQEETLRIVLRDVLEIVPTSAIIRELSDLAEASALFAARETGVEESLTVIAMGKFGGRELGYGSDLDVIFVGDDPSAAEKWMSALSVRSGAGALYNVDPRLRPEGESGLLVHSLDQFRTYFETRAQTWEVQALTKARGLFGPFTQEFEAWRLDRWSKEGRRPDLAKVISEMLERIHVERGGGDHPEGHFKTGRGGLITIEFVTQALQMRHALPEPSTPVALEKLSQEGFLDGAIGDLLTKNYRFYRRMENILRRVDNKSVSQLPKKTVDQEIAAGRLGYGNWSDLQHDLQQRREAVDKSARQIFEHL